MAGFKNSSLNFVVKQNYYEQITLVLKSCSDLMISRGVKIQNHEEKISAHIVENYLKNKSVINGLIKYNFPFSFLLEVPENYNAADNSFVGRVDIKVISMNYFLRENLNDYYTIECKRIDGTKSLNEKYITQGVSRFVVSPIKYQSYHNKNIMFAYVVKDIDILENLLKINAIHKDKLLSSISKNITYIPSESTDYAYVCESQYNLKDRTLLLSHIFYDFSSIIA